SRSKLLRNSGANASRGTCHERHLPFEIHFWHRLLSVWVHASNALTSSSVAGSKMAAAVNSGSIRLVSEVKTLRGPHSINVWMPRALMAPTHSTHRTGPKAC